MGAGVPSLNITFPEIKTGVVFAGEFVFVVFVVLLDGWFDDGVVVDG